MYLKFSGFRSISSKWRHFGRSHFEFSRVWIISWSISSNWLSGCFILTNDLEWWRKSGITWTIWSHTGYTCFRDWSRWMNTSRSEIFTGCCDQRRSRNWRRIEKIRSLKSEFSKSLAIKTTNLVLGAGWKVGFNTMHFEFLVQLILHNSFANFINLKKSLSENSKSLVETYPIT